MKHGLVEYLDVNEEDNSFIALYENEVSLTQQDSGGHDTPGDRLVHVDWARGRGDTLPTSQSESEKHLPVRDG